MTSNARLVLEEACGVTFDTKENSKTPERWMKMMRDLTDPEPHTFQFTTFESDNDEMVVIKDIEFASLCGHHLIPFIGTCDIGYVPGSKTAGLSKLARAVKLFSKGLWKQEDLTVAIASYLEEELEPRGVAVVMEAEHMCMTLRGVQARGTTTVTSCMRGVFADHARLARQEFLHFISQPTRRSR